MALELFRIFCTLSIIICLLFDYFGKFGFMYERYVIFKYVCWQYFFSRITCVLHLKKHTLDVLGHTALSYVGPVGVIMKMGEGGGNLE